MRFHFVLLTSRPPGVTPHVGTGRSPYVAASALCSSSARNRAKTLLWNRGGNRVGIVLASMRIARGLENQSRHGIPRVARDLRIDPPPERSAFEDVSWDKRRRTSTAIVTALAFAPVERDAISSGR